MNKAMMGIFNRISMVEDSFSISLIGEDDEFVVVVEGNCWIRPESFSGAAVCPKIDVIDDREQIIIKITNSKQDMTFRLYPNFIARYTVLMKRLKTLDDRVKTQNPG
ncbi:MAG: hypothetical protein GY839_19575 [candidate division Zixibacteria bacterium]|nr:hypothetical protein [candidate division Zixibacteria bacterium]